MPLAQGRASEAICDRCCFRFSYLELREDGNIKGLRVCENCYDPLDVWRLPPCAPDSLSLRFPRPDTPIGLQDTHTLPWNTPGVTWNQPGVKWNEQINDQ